MCLELEAGHENGQSEKFSESDSREAALRENLDPATEAGTRSENDAPDENKTRKRRVSKRNRRNLCKPNEDDADSKNKDESIPPEIKTCELCSERFNNSHALTLHLKEHNSNSNRNNGSAHKCTLCHKILSSKSSLDRHALVHSGYKPHKCGICGVLFTTNGNMNRHIRIHENESKRKFEISEEKKHACTEDCHHGFSDLFTFEFSSNKYPKIARMSCEKERRCAPPNSKKARSDDYEDQEVMAALRVYSCSYCDHCFPCLRTLTEHKSRCSKCKICNCQFSHIQEFEHHMLIHNSEVEESLPQTEDGIKKESIWFDVGKNEENYDDEVYSRSFENQSTEKADFFKAIGLRPLNQIKDLKVKEEDYALMDPDDMPSGYISEESNSCGELVIDESASSNVVPSNENENEYSTLSPSESPLSSPDKADLSKNDSFQAIKYSTSNDSPQKHSSSDEGLAKSLSPSDDSENSRSHTDTELPKGKFQCKKCFANFDDSKSFRSHSKTHFQHKNYKCESCTYTSVDKSTLLRHMRTHNGDRPFKCDICDFPFTTKTNAQRHIRKKHRIPRQECKKYAVYNHERSETKLPGNIAENSTETVCKYCKVDFGNSRLLKHHLRSLRDSCSRKPYTCKKCHSGFSTKNNCIRHINKTHPEYKAKVKDLLVSNRVINNESFGQILNEGENVKEAEEFADSNTNGENADIIMSDHDETQLLANEDSPVQKQIDEYKDTNCEDINSKVLNLKKDEGYLLKDSLEYPRSFSELLNTSDLVSAVDGLMSLSKSAPFQAEPLDLSLRPIDLSAKNLPSMNSVTPNNAKIFPRPLSSLREPLGDPLPIRLSIPKPYNPSSSVSSSFHGFNCEQSPSSLSSAPEEQSFTHGPNISTPVSNEHKPIPLDLSPTNESSSHNYFLSEIRIAKDSSVPDKKNIPCNYCHKTFTLKSNKERHIKNHHPERARPPRSRNFIPTLSGAPVPKLIPNVSDVTRDKLRSVLLPKVYSSPTPNEVSMSLDGEALSLVAEKIERPFEFSIKSDAIPECFLRRSAKNDFETNDLASVSSVINTANSKEINRFLKDASLTDAQAQAEERMDGSEISNNELSIDGHFGGKDKQFKCEFCGRAFNYASARERHMATHTGEKPYFCSKCNARFSTKSNRDRHEKKSCCEKTNYRNKSLTNPSKEDSKSPDNQVSLKLDFSDLSRNIGMDRLKITDSQHAISFVSSYHSDRTVNNSSGSLELSNPASNFSVHTFSSKCQSFRENLECKFCNNTYKSHDDLTNHMKELHPLEYKSLMGETFDPEDTIRSWRKTMSGKRKTTP